MVSRFEWLKQELAEVSIEFTLSKEAADEAVTQWELAVTFLTSFMQSTTPHDTIVKDKLDNEVDDEVNNEVNNEINDEEGEIEEYINYSGLSSIVYSIEGVI